MKPAQATSWITEARFGPYLAEAGGDHERAVALYVWNARVSAAMFETLHHVEVALRNAIDAQFDPVVASASVSSTWLCEPTILNEASRTRVEETIARVRREGGRVRCVRACRHEGRPPHGRSRPSQLAYAVDVPGVVRGIADEELNPGYSLAILALVESDSGLMDREASIRARLGELDKLAHSYILGHIHRIPWAGAVDR
jgi:hypothetical protein